MLSLIALAALTQQTGQSITTSFDPKRDMPHVTNDPNFINKGGSLGFCNGVQELTVAFLQVRQKNPNAFSLSEVSDIIRKYHGEAYLSQAMKAASNMAYDNGRITANMRSDPNRFVGDVVQRMEDTHQPQSIMLTQDHGFPHQVTVYGATKTDAGWQLRVSDVNHTESGVVDKITLAVDAKTGQLTSSVPGQPDEKWLQGGVVPHPTVPNDAYIDLVYSAIRGDKNLDRPLVEINQIPQEAMMATKPDDPEVGGVLIRFDPKLFTGTIDEAKLTDLSNRLNGFLHSQKDSSAILYLQGSTKRVTLVPFASLTPSRALGGLTRVDGFVVKPDGSAFIAGASEPGKPPIPGEWLAVALQSQYAAGLSPYISLDPDPTTFTGPQHVRIGDIPDNLRSTSFIKAMLDADYLMKKINLGKEVPKVEGFESWVDRMVASNAESVVRMWFTPMSLPAADSYICHRNGGLAVLFESQVAVLSEQEKNAAETGYSGSKDPVAEDSARDFTIHMDDLGREYPEIYKLRGVFDVSKLAACWRALKVKPNGIDAWLNYSPPKVAIPDAYVGIGPELTKDGMHSVGGGAVAHARFRPAAAVETDRLAPMLDAGGQADVSIEMPATLSPSEATQAAFEAQNLFASAQSEVTAGFFEEGLADIAKVLALTPDDEDAQLIQATALGLLNRYPEAIAILDKLIPNDPHLLAIRSVFEAASGDKAAALKDADAAERQFPASEAILTATTASRIGAFDIDGATKSLDRLRMVCPANPAVKLLDIQIDLLRYLGPEKAQARMALQAQIPGPISIALLQAPQSPDPVPAYRQLLEMVQSGAYSLPEGLYIPERIILAMACASLAKKPGDEDLKAIGAGVDRLIADHPDWPSGYLARFCVLMSIDASAELTGGALQKFGDLESRSDPILPELLLIMRVPKLAPLLAATATIDADIAPEARRTMALLAADDSKGSQSEKFFAALVHNPGVDVGELQKVIDRGVIFASADETAKVLDAMTATVEGVDCRAPAYLPALQYCEEALAIVAPRTLEYTNIQGRAITLAAQGEPSRYLAPMAAKVRAQIWCRFVAENLRDLMGPDSDDMKAVAAPAEAMDRLLKPESKGDSIASVAKSLDNLTAALGAFISHLRTAVSEGGKAVRTKHGDLTANAIELCVSEMQQPLNHDQTADMAKLVSLHPGIEKTASFAALKSLNDNMSAGIMLKQSEDQVWARALAGIKTPYDGLTMQALLTQLGSFAQDKGSHLAKYIAQCKLKTELGTTLSGN